MAITNRDDLINALAQTSFHATFSKTTITTVAGRPFTFFRVSGVPVGGATPSTTGAALDRTTPGALVIPAPSNTTYMVNFGVAESSINICMVYDRLVETGGLSGTVTTAQTVNSAALPSRNTTGDGTQLWLEVYTALGATPSATVTASYTNQAGTAGRTATLIGGIPASLAASSTLQFNLQAGDTGLQSVQTVTSTTSTGTAGSFGITIRDPLGVTGIPGGSSSSANGFQLGYVETGLVIIPDSACLEVLFVPAATSSGTVNGAVRGVQK
jgi:hypothetical protein